MAPIPLCVQADGREPRLRQPGPGLSSCMCCPGQGLACCPELGPCAGVLDAKVTVLGPWFSKLKRNSRAPAPLLSGVGVWPTAVCTRDSLCCGLLCSGSVFQNLPFPLLVVQQLLFSRLWFTWDLYYRLCFCERKFSKAFQNSYVYR